MATHIKTGPLHHVLLTVSDPKRSREFYMRVLGFQEVAEFDEGPWLTNGTTDLLLWRAEEPIADDQFDQNRIGLYHLSFLLADVRALQEAERILDAQKVAHGLIQDFGPDLQLYSLRLRDPDNIQIELIAAYPAR
jgi:glyoxylase I family protein